MTVHSAFNQSTVYTHSLCVRVMSVCSLPHLCQPLCSDIGTSQRPGDCALFVGVRVWKLCPPRVWRAPCGSRPRLLYLCGHARICCGRVTRPSASWDCCQWWSERARGREEITREGERERERKAGRGVPLLAQLDRVVFELWGKSVCVCVYVHIWLFVSCTVCKPSPPSRSHTPALDMFEVTLKRSRSTTFRDKRIRIRKRSI